MTLLAERHETYTASFEALGRDPVFGATAVRQARERAFDRFLSRGFPTTRDEEWRFTSVAPIAAVPFGRPPVTAIDPAEAVRLNGVPVGVPIVVVNGRLSAPIAGLPDGVTVRSLSDAPVDAVLPERADGGTVFVDLNTAFFEDVITIDVAPRAIVRDTLHVIFVSAPGADPALVSPRLTITVGEQAQCAVIESYVDLGRSGVGLATGGPVLANGVTDVRLAPGANVDHVKFQHQGDASFHMATMFVRLDRAAVFTSHSLVLGGRIVRNDIIATLEGAGAECTLNGLYVGVGDGLVDTHTTIDHAQPHCPSHEVYKGILAGRARAVFNGKILVRQDAQKTDAKQTNKALLLTDQAQINTKPQLEIFADDVKCTHGAAIGQLDEDALFYLKARGIGPIEARNMLIHAFAGQVLDGVQAEPLRRAAMARVEHLLGL
jgi:Fe-S cluster assembly protein SufD